MYASVHLYGLDVCTNFSLAVVSVRSRNDQFFRCPSANLRQRRNKNANIDAKIEIHKNLIDQRIKTG